MSLLHQKTFDIVPENLLSVRGLSMEFITKLLSSAHEMQELVKNCGGDDTLKNRILALFFCEASTRTSCSFQAAMQRLGGTVISVNSVDSSMKKGESLEDTIQTLASYCDIIAIRHPEKGSALCASKVSKKPIINAGLLYFKYLCR
jgi:aspartate carbamoyltransferase catalytic subunit